MKHAWVPVKCPALMPTSTRFPLGNRLAQLPATHTYLHGREVLNAASLQRRHRPFVHVLLLHGARSLVPDLHHSKQLIALQSLASRRRRRVTVLPAGRPKLPAVRHALLLLLLSPLLTGRRPPTLGRRRRARGGSCSRRAGRASAGISLRRRRVGAGAEQVVEVEVVQVAVLLRRRCCRRCCGGGRGGPEERVEVLAKDGRVVLSARGGLGVGILCVHVPGRSETAVSGEGSAARVEESGEREETRNYFVGSIHW